MRYSNFILAALLMVFCGAAYAQQQMDPWTEGQLMATETLATRITDGDADNLVILTIGFDAIIKGSVDIGPAMEEENVGKLREYLEELPQDAEVVIYCGCCPFERCPNVRPAFKVLNEMGFANAKLLDIPQNIKVDWLDKGYPVNDE